MKIKMRLSHKMLALVGAISLACGAFVLKVMQMQNEFAIGSPIHEQLALSNDIIADVLPPPAFVMESFLVATQLVVEPDPNSVRQLVDRGEKLKAEFNERLTFWQQAPIDPGIKAIMTGPLATTARELFRLRDTQLIPLVTKGNRVEAAKFVNGPLKSAYEAHRAVVDRIVDATRNYRQSSLDSGLSALRSRSTVTMVFGGLLLLVSVSIAGLYLGRRLAKPLDAANTSLRAVAEGDVTQRMQITSSDELGDMSQFFNRAIAHVDSSFHEIVGQVRQLATSAESLARISSNMKTATETTSQEAGKLADAATSMSNDAQTLAVAVTQLEQSIGEISRSASASAEVAARAVVIAESTNATVEKLSQSSDEIGKIIKMINTIAEQTNLLALNATIEAARAGEAGKGFGVVASEVKELAKATSQASDDVRSKIDTIRSDSTEATQALKTISGIIKEISNSQVTIASAVEEQSTTTKDISRTLASTVHGSREIADKIARLATATKDVSSGVGQTQETSVSLASLATTLRGLVSHFRTTPIGGEPQAARVISLEQRAASTRQADHHHPDAEAS